MGEVSTIGLDIAKSAFQVHGVDVAGSVVIRRRISRAKVLEYFGELPRCLEPERKRLTTESTLFATSQSATVSMPRLGWWGRFCRVLWAGN
jgi:hypothetical protein